MALVGGSYRQSAFIFRRWFVDSALLLVQCRVTEAAFDRTCNFNYVWNRPMYCAFASGFSTV